MVGPLITIIGIALAGMVLAAATFIVGMRRKSPAVTGAVIALTKRFINAGTLKTAGTTGTTTGVVHHIGRTSGKAYATPVDILPLDEDLVVALPYGTRSQWVRNVLAAGTAEMTVDGTTWTVDQAELVPTDDVRDAFPAADRRMFRLLGTDRCLRVHRVAPVEPPPIAA